MSYPLANKLSSVISWQKIAPTTVRLITSLNLSRSTTWLFAQFKTKKLLAIRGLMACFNSTIVSLQTSFRMTWCAFITSESWLARCLSSARCTRSPSNWPLAWRRTLSPSAASKPVQRVSPCRTCRNLDRQFRTFNVFLRKAKMERAVCAQVQPSPKPLSESAIEKTIGEVNECREIIHFKS